MQAYGTPMMTYSAPVTMTTAAPMTMAAPMTYAPAYGGYPMGATQQPYPLLQLCRCN